MATSAFKNHTWNAFSTTIPGGLTGSEVAPFVVTVGTNVDHLTSLVPIYLVIDPGVPLKREWVKVSAASGTSLTIEERNLAGSVGDGSHDAGAEIRAIYSKQMHDDFWSAIEKNLTDLETHEASHASFLTETEANNTYLRLDGVRAVGFEVSADQDFNGYKLTGVADPTLDQDVVTKKYLEDNGASPVHTHDGDDINDVGEIPFGVIPTGTNADEVAVGNHTHAHSDLTGTVPFADLPVGAGATQVAQGDHTHSDANYVKLNAGAVQTLQDELRTEHVRPRTDEAYDLGSATLAFRRIYAATVYDEDGTQRLNLDGAWTCAAGITAATTVTFAGGNGRLQAGSGSQVKVSNLATGKEIIVGSLAVAPGDDAVTNLGAANLQWNEIHGVDLKIDSINGIAIANYLNP